MTRADGKDASISPDAITKSDFPQTEPETTKKSKPEGDSLAAPEITKATQLPADQDSVSPKKDSEEEQTSEGKNTSTPDKSRYTSHLLCSERLF